MGGLGSGRRRRGAPKTIEYIKLDLTCFSTNEFEFGVTRTLAWMRDGELAAGAECSLSDESVDVWLVSSNGHQAQQVLSLAKTKANFGGTRRWFVCPMCGSRRRTLYLRDRFECRVCVGAVYESQYAYLRVPGEAAARTLRERFGIGPDFEVYSAEKPKRMHWKTFRAIEKTIWDADVEFDRAVEAKLG